MKTKNSTKTQGIEYQDLGEYQLAINNYTKAINEYDN